VARERKKDSQGIFQHKYGKEIFNMNIKEERFKKVENPV
jgi:hypothetical protein